jgi:hypothetical protein
MEFRMSNESKKHVVITEQVVGKKGMVGESAAKPLRGGDEGRAAAKPLKGGGNTGSTKK